MFNSFFRVLGVIFFLSIIFSIIFGEFELKINKFHYKTNGILKNFFEDKVNKKRWLNFYKKDIVKNIWIY